MVSDADQPLPQDSLVSGSAYTGLNRRKKTPWSVTFGDALVSRIISIGGIGTIAAILLVVFVLMATALPLFTSPSIEEWHELDVPKFVHSGVDEHGLLQWGMLEDGTIELRTILDGRLVQSYPRESEIAISCSQLSIDRKTLIVGLEDGTYQIAQLAFQKKLLDLQALPEQVSVTEADPVQELDGEVYQWFDETGVRRTVFDDVQWSDAKPLSDKSLLAIDYMPDQSENRLSSKTQSHVLALAGDELVFAEITGKKNMMTRKIVESADVSEVQIQLRSNTGIPLRLCFLSGVTQAVLAWPNGTIDRYSLTTGEPVYQESQSGVIGGGAMTCAAPLLARQTLLCGTDDGRLLGWMVTRSQEEDDNGAAADGYQLSLAHEVNVGEDPIVCVSSSEQTHMAITGDAAGRIALTYLTTDTLLAQIDAPEFKLEAVGTDPSGTILLAQSSAKYALAALDIGHPEASPAGYFGKVWYEGHDRPKYIWQSSAGSEKSEIKLSLVPLVFGTLKATLYAMLISVPLAILAAVYTSEFLSPAARSRIKPVVEMMASIPSVVLGYVAALVAASFLQDNLMVVLVTLIMFPMTLVLAGNLWNLFPVDLLVRLQKWRLPAMVACVPVAIWLSMLIAGLVERVFFNGDIVQWISSGEGSATGGWMILLLPLLTLAATFVLVGPLAEQTRAIAVRRSPRSFALLALARLGIIALAVIGLSWLVGVSLNGIGWDLRDQLFTNYRDRNALLVGGALGFCVIPIIFTISDDALQAVPQHLRSASLGCGATPWQTTVRVVIPSAMSGLFSAIMIGLGRAVGETMVVLMAAGNTPIMEWNPFNGFSTLSATLATELAEAAKGSTHFRTLFLAALLLFFFTLIANTLAEFVRIRFRKRASQL